MKKLKPFLTVLVITSAFLFTGCSHNQGALISGKAFIIGGQGIQYYNGTILLDNSRENSSWKVDISDEDSASSTQPQSSETASSATPQAKGIKYIERTVQKQITGYLVEMSEKDPEAVKEYLKQTQAEQK